MRSATLSQISDMQPPASDQAVERARCCSRHVCSTDTNSGHLRAGARGTCARWPADVPARPPRPRVLIGQDSCAIDLRLRSVERNRRRQQKTGSCACIGGGATWIRLRRLHEGPLGKPDVSSTAHHHVRAHAVLSKAASVRAHTDRPVPVATRRDKPVLLPCSGLSCVQPPMQILLTIIATGMLREQCEKSSSL